MGRLMLICFGGALGSGARYLVGGYVAALAGPEFPYGTFLINASGSFLIAVVMVLALEVGVISPELRLFLATGVMGGYTTYSSFNYETLRLAERRAWFAAATYLALTVMGCLAAGFLGIVTGRTLTRTRPGRS